MKALVYDGTLRLESDRPIPHTPGEALIRVRLAGICNTDLELMRGYKSFAGVPGHEFVGEVVQSSDAFWNGRRMCGEINTRCGACRYCLAGMLGHCAHRTVLGILNRSGAFAEYTSLPLENLHIVPDSVPDEHAVYVEPLAAAFQILEQVDVQRSDRVMVLGDGKLGLLCAQVLALHSGHVILVGHHPAKLALAEHWGIDTALACDEMAGEIDVVIEATGSPAGLETALTFVRPRGTVVLKSTTAADTRVDMSPAVVKEVTIVGSRCGPFPRAIEALRREEVDVTSLTEATYSLDNGVQALEHAARRGSLKVLIQVQ